MSSKAIEQQVEDQILASYPSLYRLAYTYVNNPDDAMDVIQESVCKAIQNAHSVKDRAHMKTWLCRIVINTAYDFLRRRSRETDLDTVPEQGREDRYTDTDTLQALNVLEPREREIIILRFFEDYKLREIAQILDENENTVKTTLYRSLKKLKEQLSEGDVPHAQKSY